MSHPRRVLICNERFLARFGVDRILVLLGDHLRAEGWDVEFAALRFDRTVLERISANVTQIDVPDGLDLAGADLLVAEQLLKDWEASRPHVLITGGWPFFGIAARAATRGVRSVFIDAGAVPHDGMPDGALPTQLELRRLRQTTLPSIAAVLPISDFIRFSQTEPDRGSSEGVETVLLGADHMERRHFDHTARGDDALDVLSEIRQSVEQGTSLIVALGRFEPSGYKNSAAAFGVMRQIAAACPDTRLAVLAGQEVVHVPDDLTGAVICLPSLTDRELQELMRLSTLGVSLSLWEGFNLPIAEMQALKKPALALNIGAHPEVIADPWLLCETVGEMARKAVEIIAHGVPAALTRLQRFEENSQRLRWDRCLARWEELALPLSAATLDGLLALRKRTILVDVSNSARDPANSGVIRVTRRLSAHLATEDGLEIVFVIWNEGRQTYELLTPAHHVFLSSNAGPQDWLGRAAASLGSNVQLEQVMAAADPLCDAPPILLIPEVILDGTAPTRTAWARSRGFRVTAILYDMLPIYEARFVSASVTDAFPSYLSALAGADAIWSISEFSLSEFKRYHADAPTPLPSEQIAIWLPGQFSAEARLTALDAPGPDIVVLCVSTLEPRKNHATLLTAFRSLRQRRPDLPLRLVLVGNRYADDQQVGPLVEAAVRDDPAVTWVGNVKDAILAALYREARFTVYASLVEGFGLPIMESLWMGRPCICHDEGVMAELAADGGCLTIDMTKSDELSRAMERLAFDPALLESLVRQIGTREIATWSSYASQLAERLRAN